jgi:hypothetical protein
MRKGNVCLRRGEHNSSRVKASLLSLQASQTDRRVVIYNAITSVGLNRFKSVSKATRALCGFLLVQ